MHYATGSPGGRTLYSGYTPLPLSPAEAGDQVFQEGGVFYVYMLASGRNGTLYLGYTDDLVRRMVEHKAHRLGGFTARYGVDALVWYETHATRESAWTREKRMKSWRRVWKLALIERANPEWRDLFAELAPVTASLRSRLPD